MELKITSENFESEVLKSDKPVLIDFWADWCGPCKMLAPVISQIAEENEGIIKTGKINVDEEPELAKEFGIISIPTVMLFEGGKQTKMSVGLVPKEKLEKLFK